MGKLITDINLLQPSFREKVIVFLSELDDNKIEYKINETLRTLETQMAYYSQGRKSLITVNVLRNKSGLYLISEEDNKKIITWTMKSKHLDGLAIDIVPTIYGRVQWNAPDEKWRQIAEISKKCGLNAGYYWKQHDSPHHEEI